MKDSADSGSSRMPTGAVELAKDRFRAVLRKDHPFSSLEQVELPDLLEDPLLVSSGGCEPQIRKLHALSGIRYSPAQRVRESSTLLSMVESDIGLAIMPSLASSMLPSTLVMVDINPCLDRRLVFAGPSDRSWRPQVTRMLELIASLLAPGQEATPPRSRHPRAPRAEPPARPKPGRISDRSER